jgi:hypothetical protein
VSGRTFNARAGIVLLDCTAGNGGPSRAPPSEFVPVAAAQWPRSERVAERELERTRPTGTEELSRRVQSVIKSRRVDGIVDSGVVPIGCSPDVGDIEQVEGFSDRLQSMRLLEMKRPRQSHVKRVEAVAELDFRVYLKRPGSSGVPELSLVAWKRARSVPVGEARRQRIVSDNGCVQRCPVSNLPSQSVARDIRQPAAQSSYEGILGNAGRPSPDG